ncbi:hypothetical protein [Thauera sp. GDN1]|uniref:hypothetical protein n=1 Tax=Thauera sp. GDN1 TaxID=2944810 RepID=UPI0024791711|nr:hypothetical protein [Thauera sp. GDN1]
MTLAWSPAVKPWRAGISTGVTTTSARIDTGYQAGLKSWMVPPRSIQMFLYTIS